MSNFKIKSALQLSALIGDVRKIRQLRQQDMAEKLHTTQQSYARMELNIGSSKVETLLDILQALDVELVLRPKEGNSNATAKPKLPRRVAPVSKIMKRFVTAPTNEKKKLVVIFSEVNKESKSATKNVANDSNQAIGKAMRKKIKW